MTKRNTIKTTDDFFAPLENTKPYFKAGFQGFAGSGKTYTAALVALGLHRLIGSKKPVVIFDTERASEFLKKLFSDHKIEVLVRESRSMADLGLTITEIYNPINHVKMIQLRAYTSYKIASNIVLLQRHIMEIPVINRKLPGA